MKRKFLSLSKTMFFTKWSGKGYLILSSLRSCVKISVLSLCYFVLNTFNTIAQTDTVKIQDITVSAYKTKTTLSNTARVINIMSAKEIDELPITSIPDALKSVMNIDVRERGTYGIQSDLNIRGGSFEQNIVLINGVKMTDPQTGHLQMNLPIDLMDINRIEVLRGSSSGLYGNNAFSGAVNFITGNDNHSGIKATVMGGEHGLFGANLGLNLSSKKLKNYISVSKKISDGYTNNSDFDILNLFYKGKLITNAGYLQIQTGYLDKSFGAHNFYTPKFPDQYEENKTIMANVKFFSSGNLKINPSIYWRRNYDKFELFRYIEKAPSWYKNPNYHRTDVYGAYVSGEIPSTLGNLGFNVEWNTEAVLSNVLGDKLDNAKDISGVEDVKYTHGKTRQNFNIALEKQLKFNSLIISAQILSNYNSMFDWNFYPAIDLNYGLSEKVKLIASVNMSGRAPSYTELYYTTSSHESNPNLKLEKAISYEVGSKLITDALFVQASTYYRQGYDIIDWIRLNLKDKPKSMNLSKINTIGFDFIAKINMKKLVGENFFVNSVLLNYNYIDMGLKKQDFFSEYVLDYLRHNASISVNHSIIKNLTASWQVNFKYRNGNYLPYTEIDGKWAFREAKSYEPTFLFDAKLNYAIKNFNLFAKVKNIFDVKNQDHQNVFLPGRWISGGVTFNINLGNK